MRNATPAPASTSNTATFASIGAPPSHEVVKQRLALNSQRAGLGMSLVANDFQREPITGDEKGKTGFTGFVHQSPGGNQCLESFWFHLLLVGL
jgi:hypothetical protein